MYDNVIDLRARSVEALKARREEAEKRKLHKDAGATSKGNTPSIDTAKNFEIRVRRREAWSFAERMTKYWRARLGWGSALGIAQQYGIADSSSFLPPSERAELVKKWRAAVGYQLITPAPHLSAVAWKRGKLISREFAHLTVNKERVQWAISEDLAFLAAHSTRSKNGTPS
jgi:hypothetical protein